MNLKENLFRENVGKRVVFKDGPNVYCRKIIRLSKNDKAVLFEGAIFDIWFSVKDIEFVDVEK